MKLPPLILASASPRRSELLRELKIPFRVIPSAATEIQPGHLTVSEIARINAWRKARLVAREHPDALVLGMDTLVALGTTLFGKPKNLAQATAMLRQLQGHEHQVVTGVCAIHLASRRFRIFSDMTHVHFRRLTLAQIRHYHSLIQPLDKAGAYAIQDHGDLIVEKTAGSFSNVVGLPVEKLREELRAFAKMPGGRGTAK